MMREFFKYFFMHHYPYSNIQIEAVQNTKAPTHAHTQHTLKNTHTHTHTHTHKKNFQLLTIVFKVLWISLPHKFVKFCCQTLSASIVAMVPTRKQTNKKKMHTDGSKLKHTIDFRLLAFLLHNTLPKNVPSKPPSLRM